MDLDVKALNFKFLFLLFLPVLLFLLFLLGEQFGRGQVAQTILDRIMLLQAGPSVTVEARLFSQNCRALVGIRRIDSRGLTLVYHYRYAGKSFTETLFAPLVTCREMDLNGDGSPSRYMDRFPLLVLKAKPDLSIPQKLAEDPVFQNKLNAEKKPDHALQTLLDQLGHEPWILLIVIAFVWLSDRFRRWLYS
ncbi:MAG: hypothetical protein OIF58_00355 [Cohaesibacter sp.]|nr:hypothetical protein [Cohaesibacter sp.]